ncbi:MAG: carboxypeptidase regulatory-like domain-containing protein, partial [Planctomycetota bacterium]
MSSTRWAAPVLASLLIIGGLLYVLLDQGGEPKTQPEDPQPELTDDPPDPEEEAAEIATPEAPEEAVEDKPESEEPDRQYRPLLKNGGWKISGRLVEVPEDDLGLDLPSYPNATPLRGVSVRLKPHPRHPTDDPIAVHERITGADGTFEYSGIPGDAWLRIEIDAPERVYRTLSFQLGSPDATAHKELGDLPLEIGTDLTVRLVDEQGGPIRKGTILINAHSSNPRRSQRIRNLRIYESRRKAIEKEPGVYVLERAARGQLYAEANAPGFSPADRTSFDSPLTEDLVIELEPGHTIAGRVVDLDGNPIVAARLEAGSSSSPDKTKSDEEGYFLLDGLSAGSHRVRCKAKGYVESSKSDVETGTEDLEFQLIPAAEIIGRVIDKKTGEPIAGIAIGAMQDDTRSFRSSNGTTTKEDGTFRLDGISAGAYRIYVNSEAHALYMSEAPFDLVAQETRDVGDIELTEGLSVTVAVVAEGSDDPVEGADVALRIQAQLNSRVPMPSRSAKTGKDGRGTITGLSPGMYIVAVTHKKFLGKQPEPIEVTDEESQEFQFSLEPGGTIAGRILDRRGKPISGATVRLNVQLMDNNDWQRLNQNFNNLFNTTFSRKQLYKFDTQDLRLPKRRLVTGKQDHFDVGVNADGDSVV